MPVLQLDKCQNVAEVVQLIRDASLQDGMQTVLYGDEFIGTVLAPNMIREVIQDRILKRFSESPKLLDELRDRLESEDIVD